ncbi:unnamed protein product [Didymodactylos carnosus]|uniref:Uncharacterized protein n=1 Tax=Didymodactylos carnosus TaxID=1234261 RepID=A0A814ENW0_9BILA|nr:unnamed protein product [Didymodactylos carnosus]CAF0974805.1 unnamed protein product [Didymodactylos carnosus]CAF3578854.1 unnamed protein product [Didymodactylos carnosus]CAF3747671.1 unnamed protein product [Didymodactylos carnosus]
MYFIKSSNNEPTMTLTDKTDEHINHHQDEKDDSGIEQDNSIIYIKIAVEDQSLQKVLKFNLDDTVWSAKLKVLQHLLKEVNDGLNFGLYSPPSNGRVGKFLDESRCLRDYPLCQPVGYLETNIKKFVDCIKMDQTYKVVRYLERGFDPNLQIDDETPLTYAVDLEDPREMIMALVNGGAHLDYRTRNGQTPLHKAARDNKKAAILIILELGGSPNVYDGKQLTPLYYCILNKADPYCAQLLLQDHSIVDCVDENLSTEIHQACRLGLVQHIENLLFYRADINAKNTAGNTPLHVCAANNQEPCARVLLFRGADTTSVNKANQTPHDLALISQNSIIASIIQQLKPEDVVPYRENPVINPKRRNIYIERRLRTNCTSTSSSLKSRSQRSPIVQTSAVNGGYTYSRKRLYAAAPGRKCVCIKPFKAQQQGELTLKKGDIIEILSVGEHGYLEGRSKDSEENGETTNDDTIVISRDTLSALMINNDSFIPRTVVLQRGKKGFGFVLRGSKVVGQVFNPTPSHPALQFLDIIEEGSNADKAGLKQNDYVLEINNMNVVSMSHEECVNFIKKAGDTLALKVVTAVPITNDCVSPVTPVRNNNNPPQSLACRRKAPILIRLPDPSGICETLVRKDFGLCSDSYYSHYVLKIIRMKKRKNCLITFLEELDRTLAEYEYGKEGALPNMNNIVTTTPSLSIKRGKPKPVVPERDSSLYDCSSTTISGQPQQQQQIYGTFRPLPSSLQTERNLATNVSNIRRNSNSSSNEADEESSLSSLNSNQHPKNSFVEVTSSSTLTTNTSTASDGIYMTPSLMMNTSTPLTTFKGIAPLAPPSVAPSFPSSFPSSIDKVKPSDVKKRSMVKKQSLHAPLNSNNNNNNRDSETMNSDNEKQQSVPPPPPPFPSQLNKLSVQQQPLQESPPQLKHVNEKPVKSTPMIVGNGNLQTEIEQARNRLKKPQSIQIGQTPKKEIVQSKPEQQRPLSALPNGRTNQSSRSSLNTPRSSSNTPRPSLNTPRSTNLHSSSTYTELKSIVIEDLTPSTTITSFPPPPSPTTLRKNITIEQNITPRRSPNEQSLSTSSPTTTTKSISSLATSSPVIADVRHDANFSSVIAQKAAEKQARFSETKPVKQIPVTFFSGINQANIQQQPFNRVTIATANGTITPGNVKQTANVNNYFNGESSRSHITSFSSTVISSPSMPPSPSQSSSLSNSPVHQQRFSHAANQLLEGLKRRTTQPQQIMIKRYNHHGDSGGDS